MGERSLPRSSRHPRVSPIIPILVLGLMASLSLSTIVVFSSPVSTKRARINGFTFLVARA